MEKKDTRDINILLIQLEGKKGFYLTLLTLHTMLALYKSFYVYVYALIHTFSRKPSYISAHVKTFVESHTL